MQKELIILITHYNDLEGLKCTLSSIQEPFEIDILVVDDGSKIKPELESLKKIYRSGEIFLEFLPENQGLEKALNHGLRTIKQSVYRFIGRLDCGDLCYSSKFQKQLNYLKNNEDVYLLGTWAEAVNTHLDFLFNIKHPVKYEDIKRKMYINSMFVHPSVVFRTEIIDTVGYYPESYKSAEDYAYFFEVMKKHKVENYPEVLLKYVMNPNSISATKRKQQVKNRILIILKNFKFRFYPIYGLTRSFILYFMSRENTTFLKKYIFTK